MFILRVYSVVCCGGLGRRRRRQWLTSERSRDYVDEIPRFFGPLWSSYIYFSYSRISSDTAIMPWFGEDPQKKMMGRLTIKRKRWNYRRWSLVVSCYIWIEGNCDCWSVFGSEYSFLQRRQCVKQRNRLILGYYSFVAFLRWLTNIGKNVTEEMMSNTDLRVKAMCLCKLVSCFERIYHELPLQTKHSYATGQDKHALTPCHWPGMDYFRLCLFFVKLKQLFKCFHVSVYRS